jgi:phosphoglycerate kinase
MSYNLKSVKDARIESKTVLLRLDLDVPVENEEIQDDNRLVAGFKTLEFLLKKAKKVVICGHLDRPTPQFKLLNSKFQISKNKQIIKDNKSLNLLPVARWLKKELGIRTSDFKQCEVDGFSGWSLGENTFLLENIRFFEGEAENASEFAKKLASIADIFVNDAFAVCHRANASVAGVAKLLPSYAGFRLLEEVENLSKVLDNPKRPMVVIVGGAKISTKLPLVEKMYKIADFVLVGGKIAKEEEVLFKVSKQKMAKNHSILNVAHLIPSEEDISTKSLENFLEVIKLGKTIVWNGPVGLVEDSRYVENSKKIAEKIIETKAYSVIGGGDTVNFIKKIKMENRFSFVSTGGGAMLEFLAEEKLPGLEVLNSS